MIDPIVPLLASLAGALLFGAAAAHKLRSPGEFVETLVDYRVLPAALTPAIAWLLIVVELAVAAAFIWPVTRALGGAAGAVLMLAYACAIAINLARGRRDLDCGCGLQSKAIGGWMVARNLLLAALFATTLQPQTARVLTMVDYATVGAAILVGALLYLATDMLFGRPALRRVGATETP